MANFNRIIGHGGSLLGLILILSQVLFRAEPSNILRADSNNLHEYFQDNSQGGVSECNPHMNTQEVVSDHWSLGPAQTGGTLG